MSQRVLLIGWDHVEPSPGPAEAPNLSPLARGGSKELRDSAASSSVTDPGFGHDSFRSPQGHRIRPGDLGADSPVLQPQGNDGDRARAGASLPQGPSHCLRDGTPIPSRAQVPACSVGSPRPRAPAWACPALTWSSCSPGCPASSRAQVPPATHRPAPSSPGGRARSCPPGHSPALRGHRSSPKSPLASAQQLRLTAQPAGDTRACLGTGGSGGSGTWRGPLQGRRGQVA